MANTTRLCEDLVCDQQSVRSWFSRLDEGLRLIKNVTNRDKVSHLISNIGDEGFQHLRSLTEPEEPNTKSYDELKVLVSVFTFTAPSMLSSMKSSVVPQIILSHFLFQSMWGTVK